MLDDISGGTARQSLKFGSPQGSVPCGATLNENRIAEKHIVNCPCSDHTHTDLRHCNDGQWPPARRWTFLAGGLLEAPCEKRLPAPQMPNVENWFLGTQSDDLRTEPYARTISFLDAARTLSLAGGPSKVSFRDGARDPVAHADRGLSAFNAAGRYGSVARSSRRPG